MSGRSGAVKPQPSVPIRVLWMTMIMGRVYLAFAIAFAAVGSVQSARWLSHGAHPGVLLVTFLPAAAFLGAYGWSRRAHWSGKHAPAIVACLLVAGCWGVSSWVLDSIELATTEVTDATRHEQILDKYWSHEEDLIAHFPRPIPADARDVRFSFLPGCLQGGAHVQLRYATSAEVIAELCRKFATLKTVSFVGGDRNKHANMKDGMPTTFFHTSEDEGRSFPADYEIMVFDQLPTEEERKAALWNHGRSHGVAISQQRNEIVYWAEHW